MADRDFLGFAKFLEQEQLRTRQTVDMLQLLGVQVDSSDDLAERNQHVIVRRLVVDHERLASRVFCTRNNN
jgi:hypothetical protein